LMMSLWDALRMNMMISYQELVRTFPSSAVTAQYSPKITKPKALTSGSKFMLLPAHIKLAQYQIHTKYMPFSSVLQDL
ncbi:hypothetical protein ACLH2P_26035, partial [Klebsiella michiganensis]